ncbi:MAG: thermonuclease family protein [Solirubrobacterales bacterium]|nr:thermonuclease family protein [Solirubrobacterales bacterium]
MSLLRTDHRTAGILLLAALTALAIASLSCGGSAIPNGPFNAEVVRVVDGDTIIVDYEGSTERVRYIGVDTPESVKPNTPVQCYAKAASHLNESLVGGQRVTLTPGTEPRDRYGRLLAYVKTERGLDVNAALLSAGAAKTMSISPNTEKATEYADLEAKARNKQAGLWGLCADAQNLSGALVPSTG